MDTNVLSELARPRPNPGVVRWASEVERVSISVVTIDEVMFGLTWKPNDRARHWLINFFDEGCDILPVTRPIAHRAGVMRGKLRGEGITRSQPDMLIAATADVHGLTLVTRNVSDFEGCPIELLNPFA